MEARFVVRHKIDYESARAFGKIQAPLKKGRVIGSVIDLLWSLALWRLLKRAFIQPEYARYAAIKNIMLFLMLCSAVLNLIKVFTHENTMANRALYNVNMKAGEGVCSFDEEGMDARDALVESRYQYGSFMRIVKSEDYYFLYINKVMAYILPVQKFEVGEPTEFAAFISEKTGLEVEHV